MTFDEQVAALRGKVEPKYFDGRKAEATPEQWAARLDHTLRWRCENCERDRESTRESTARWRMANPERSREVNRRWVSSGSRNEDQRRLRKTDVQFRLSESLRVRLAHAMSGRSRGGSAVRDLGCSVADLKAHLERQFLPGMTWDNWGVGQGKWQIDHIYPLAQADLTVRLVVLAVCNWRNLQPLWFEDNIRKGDTVTPEAQQLFDGLVSEFTDNEGGA